MKMAPEMSGFIKGLPLQNPKTEGSLVRISKWKFKLEHRIENLFLVHFQGFRFPLILNHSELNLEIVCQTALTNYSVRVSLVLR